MKGKVCAQCADGGSGDSDQRSKGRRVELCCCPFPGAGRQRWAPGKLRHFRRAVSCALGGRPGQPFPGKIPAKVLRHNLPGGNGSDLGQMQLWALNAFGTLIPPSVCTAVHPGTRPRIRKVRGQRLPRASRSASVAPPPQSRVLLTKAKRPATARVPE